MRIGGLASGMDIDSIVRDMMAVQKMPLDKLMQKKAFTEWQQDAFRETNLAFSNLRTSASNLRLQSSFNAYSAVSSNPSSVGVATTASAMSGTYSVKVNSVASSAKMHSAEEILNSAGDPASASNRIQVTGTQTITIKDAAGAAIGDPIEIDNTMTYADVATKIEAASAGGVPELRASFDNTTSRFFFSTKGMGENQNFTMDFSNAELANQVVNNGANSITTIPTDPVTTVDHITSAKSGEVEVDGIVIGDLATNKTTVNGLTLNLVQASADISTIKVQSNAEKPAQMIKDFVEQYNETISTIEKQLIEKRYPDFQPLSDEQKKEMSEKEVELWEEKARSGLLRNDPLLRSALQDLRQEFMNPVDGIADGNIEMLSQIGINTGNYREGGKLFINEAKLNEVLTNNPDEVMELFTKSDATGLGIGERVYGKLNDIVSSLSSKAGSQTTGVDNSTLSKNIRQMNEDINRWQDKLIRVEDRYWKQFTAMEKALNQMNQQSVWMQQNMFGGM